MTQFILDERKSRKRWKFSGFVEVFNLNIVELLEFVLFAPSLVESTMWSIELAF